MSASLLWTLMVCGVAVSSDIFTGTTVVEVPFLMSWKGCTGLGSRLAHVPLWKWTGCTAPVGAPCKWITTLVLLPSAARVAVPLVLESLVGFSATVMASAAKAGSNRRARPLSSSRQERTGDHCADEGRRHVYGAGRHEAVGCAICKLRGGESARQRPYHSERRRRNARTTEALISGLFHDSGLRRTDVGRGNGIGKSRCRLVLQV